MLRKQIALLGRCFSSNNTSVVTALFLLRILAVECVLSFFSHGLLIVTLWTVTLGAPLSAGFSRPEYWNRLLCPLAIDLLFNCLVVSDSSRPRGLQPTGLLCPWDFQKQESWNGIGFPFSSPGDFPNLGIKLGSPSSLSLAPPGKPIELNQQLRKR